VPCWKLHKIFFTALRGAGFFSHAVETRLLKITAYLLYPERLSENDVRRWSRGDRAVKVHDVRNAGFAEQNNQDFFLFPGEILPEFPCQRSGTADRDLTGKDTQLYPRQSPGEQEVHEPVPDFRIRNIVTDHDKDRFHTTTSPFASFTGTQKAGMPSVLTGRLPATGPVR